MSAAGSRRGRRSPLVVAVTGGIAAGKSTFCRLVGELGAVAHIDADALVHELLERDGNVRRRVRERFGAEIFRADGSVDRAALASQAFADPAAREALEAILHPPVRARLARRVGALRRRGEVAIVLVEIPLLAETGRPPWVDRVVTIEAPRGVRQARLAAKGLSPTEIRRRLAAQASRTEREACADDVVNNAGDRDALAAAAGALWRAWRSP